MKFLMLGGTQFLGRHLVEIALRRGHDVTLFNRGQTAPGLFDVRTLIGDRDGNLGPLETWQGDAVIDTSGYVPRVVRESVSRLKSRASHYTFVSSVSVYEDFSQAQMTEDSARAKPKEPNSENVNEDYGGLKASCEDVVVEEFGRDVLIVRPGLLVGPYDPTDRFTYWVRRWSQGGPVLAPGLPDAPTQWIDVRDVADWILTQVEARVTGVYNLTGAPGTMGDLMDVLAVQTEGGPATWVSEEFLLENGVREWSDLPLWIAKQTNWPGFMRVNIDRALDRGLRLRPWADTVRDTLAWDRERGAPPLKSGLSVARAEELLAAWKDIVPTKSEQGGR